MSRYVILFVCIGLSYSAAGSAQEKAGALRRSKVAKIDDRFPRKIRRHFDRFAQVIAPNSKPINILAQTEISDAQLRRVRDVLFHYLTDLPKSKFGHDKSRLANRMADHRALLVILKGSDGQFRNAPVYGQPLYDTETIVEGSAAYINNDFEDHRDATFEEVLHLVHDFGIGIDIARAPRGVLPEYQKAIRRATTQAMKKKIWPTEHMKNETDEWIEELRVEGSLTQEYLASVIDSYYGLWGPFDKDYGMWGIYLAKTRKDIAAKDPDGLKIVEQFFHPYLTYMAEIDSSFKGTFKMAFDPIVLYTHKSQYLLHARLTGRLNSNLTGNDQDNHLSGNAGDNVIDGGGGVDIVFYPRQKSAYRITENKDGSTVVVGDGTDRLLNVENIKFNDEERQQKNIVDPVNPNLR